MYVNPIFNLFKYDCNSISWAILFSSWTFHLFFLANLICEAISSPKFNFCSLAKSFAENQRPMSKILLLFYDDWFHNMQPLCKCLIASSYNSNSSKACPRKKCPFIKLESISKARLQSWQDASHLLSFKWHKARFVKYVAIFGFLICKI